MKPKQQYEQDLESIRQTMERSIKVLSLSGLSGVLAGIYALAGTGIAYYLLYYPFNPYGLSPSVSEQSVITPLLITAVAVLLLSLATGVFMSFSKAKKLNVSLWNSTSKELVINLSVPLVSGGLFILVLLTGGYYELIVSASLLFYGIALVQGSRYTYNEMQIVGYGELILGILAAFFPAFSLLLWGAGFGVLHIIYGAIMHYRYDS